jgi:hypothetical protein
MPRKDPLTGKPAIDWKAIKGMFIAGTTFKELSKKFKVPQGTIKTRAYRQNWLGKELSPRVIKKVEKQLKQNAIEADEKVWRDRAEQIREREYTAASRILEFTELMTEEDLLLKVEKVKTAADMGRRATGIDDKKTDANAINIAVLSDIDFLNSEARLYKRRTLSDIDAVFEEDKP